MGMTIDEAKEWLVSRKEHYELDDNCQELAQALDIALVIMRKYQKIEQIYSDYLKYMNPDNLADRMGEVLEDGRN